MTMTTMMVSDSGGPVVCSAYLVHRMGENWASARLRCVLMPAGPSDAPVQSYRRTIV
jgi:hypothetical protein